MKIMDILVFLKKFGTLICTNESKLKAIESSEGVSEFLNVNEVFTKITKLHKGLIKFPYFFPYQFASGTIPHIFHPSFIRRLVNYHLL
jgi:hypothetical protein